MQSGLADGEPERLPSLVGMRLGIECGDSRPRLSARHRRAFLLLVGTQVDVAMKALLAEHAGLCLAALGGRTKASAPTFFALTPSLRQSSSRAALDQTAPSTLLRAGLGGCLYIQPNWIARIEMLPKSNPSYGYDTASRSSVLPMQ